MASQRRDSRGFAGNLLTLACSQTGRAVNYMGGKAGFVRRKGAVSCVVMLPGFALSRQSSLSAWLGPVGPSKSPITQAKPTIRSKQAAMLMKTPKPSVVRSSAGS